MPVTLFAASILLAKLTASPIAVILLRPGGADAAQHDVSAVHAYADPEALSVDVRVIGAKLFHRVQHFDSRQHGVERRRLLIRGAEDRHESVSHVIVDVAMMTLNDFIHTMEVTVQRMDDVIRGKFFGECGKAADIGKKNGDTFLFADQTADFGESELIGQGHVGGIQYQAPQFHLPRHTGLAGKPDIRAEMQLIGHLLFFRIAGCAVLHAGNDQHPACRATGMASANMGVRNS